jgi:hypothetical protein
MNKRLGSREQAGLAQTHSSIVTRLAIMIILGYAAIYYAIPLLLTVLFGPYIDQFLRYPPNYLYGAIMISAVIGLLCFYVMKLDRTDGKFSIPAPSFMFQPWFVAPIGFIYLIVSYYFSENLGIEYRQTGTRIGATEGGMLVIFLYIIQTYLTVYIILTLSFTNSYIKANRPLILFSCMTYLFGTFLSLAASSGVIMLAMGLIQTIRIMGYNGFLRPGETGTKLFTILVIPAAFLGAVFVGIGNKLGTDQSALLFLNNFRIVIEIIQYRISYHLYSASFHTTFNFTNLELGWLSVENVIENISHRLDVVLGNPTFSNDIASVKRLNYEEISYFIKDRTGASPGIVGGLFFYPFGVFIIPLTTYIYARTFRSIAYLAGTKPIGLIELFFLVSIAAGILDSSLDALNPLDPSFIRWLFLFLGVSWVSKHRLSMENKSRKITFDAGQKAMA